jgi:hypothetical protein
VRACLRDDNRHPGCLDYTTRNASLESTPARSDHQQPSLASNCDFDKLIDWVAVDDFPLRHDAPLGGHRQGDVERAVSAE